MESSYFKLGYLIIGCDLKPKFPVPSMFSPNVVPDISAFISLSSINFQKIVLENVYIWVKT